MFELDFEKLGFETQQWYREKIGEEVPDLNFERVPEFIAQSMDPSAMSHAHFGRNDFVYDMVAIQRVMQEAMNQVVAEGYRTNLSPAMQSPEIDAPQSNQISISFDVKSYDKDTMEYFESFGENTIFIYPLLFGFSSQYIQAVVAQSTAGMLQRRKGLDRKYPLSKDGIADFIRLYNLSQHRNWREIFDEERASSLVAPPESLSVQGSEESAWGLEAACHVFGYSMVDMEGLRSAKLHHLFEDDTTRLIEVRAAYNMFKNRFAANRSEPTSE